MSNGHSILAPSSAARNIQCPASTLAEQQFPETGDSPEAIEGTAAHLVMSEGLEGRRIEVGTQTPNGAVVTDEMVEGASLVWDVVSEIVQRHGATYVRIDVEKPVSIQRIHTQCYGTPDVVVWATAHDGLHLYVIDFKFGHGPVEVFENPQLVDYAIGKADEAGIDDLNPGCKVHACIVQPRAFHKDGPTRWWHTTLVDLRPLVNRRSNAAHEALGPSPRYRVGDECDNCRARHACPTLQAEAGHMADYVNGAQPLVLNDTALGLELLYLERARKMLEARISGLKEQATQAFRMGRRVPWWNIERSPGREVWARPVSEVLAVADAMGVDVRKPVAVLTPKQAREKGLHESLVAVFAQRKPGEAKLVYDADNSTTRKIFGNNA